MSKWVASACPQTPLKQVCPTERHPAGWSARLPWPGRAGGAGGRRATSVGVRGRHAGHRDLHVRGRERRRTRHGHIPSQCARCVAERGQEHGELRVERKAALWLCEGREGLLQTAVYILFFFTLKNDHGMFAFTWKYHNRSWRDIRNSGEIRSANE